MVEMLDKEFKSPVFKIINDLKEDWNKLMKSIQDLNEKVH
jgi:hypothetical protein